MPTNADGPSSDLTSAERSESVTNAAPPVAWQAIGIWLFASLLAALFFLASATYSKTEDVSGIIALDKGVAAVIPPQAGVVAAVDVKDGQAVAKGQPLITVRSTSTTIDGTTSAERQKIALGMKLSRLEDQYAAQVASHDVSNMQLADQSSQLRKLLSEIDLQIKQQHALIKLADDNYSSMRVLQEKGFVSNRSIREEEATLISRRQQLSQLLSTRQEAFSRLLVSRKQALVARAFLAEQKATSAAQQADVERQISEISNLQGYRLVAPISGVITALSARVGQTTSSNPLMLVIPDGSRVTAELYVPTRSIGFLKPGQIVRLAVDAFPFEQFGTIDAKIDEISRVGTERATPSGIASPMFLVRTSISRSTIQAYGQHFPLTPGMTLRARIVTRSRNLLEWLFEPFHAAYNR